MNDVLDNSANVTIALSEIEVTELGGVFVVVGVRFELNENVRFGSSKGVELKVGRTMACERLCALITRPISFSVS